VSAESHSTTSERARASIEGYYRRHSRIYDATRWTFLFGRDAILSEVAAVASPSRILEVGCGTGKNLVNLCRAFPQAEVMGVDLSATMLEVARRKTARFGPRVRLSQQAYGPDFAAAASCDLVLFSYALSMFNPGFEDAIAAARGHLVDGGHIAVVDFHDTRWPLFARWMGVNHVRMDGQLRPLLVPGFAPRTDSLRAAYGGIWRYLLFVGRKDGGGGEE
jgi:S-adenosylmethionine-diacylgycerolhomoserine-N-methlytransferase